MNLAYWTLASWSAQGLPAGFASEQTDAAGQLIWDRVGCRDAVGRAAKPGAKTTAMGQRAAATSES